MGTESVRSLLANTNVQAFLRVIRAGESNQNDDAYTLINGGGHFSDLSHHPWHGIPTTQGGKACGAYQFLGTTWARLVAMYPADMPDFSKESQDFGAVADIFGHKNAAKCIIEGDLAGAVDALRDEWVSLPTMTASRVRSVFAQYGGVEKMTQQAAPIEEKSEVLPQPEKTMGPLMFLPAILQMIPSIVGLFSKGGKAEGNQKIAQTVVDVFTAAVPGAVNTQDAIEKASADPQVKAVATQAVMANPVIEQLLEIGPTQLKEARNANLSLMAAAPKWWQLVLNPVFLVTLLTLPLVYMFVYGMTFGAKEAGLLNKVSADVIAQTMGTVIGLVLGGVMGFWMGQTYTQSNRRTTEQQTPSVGG